MPWDKNQQKDFANGNQDEWTYNQKNEAKQKLYDKIYMEHMDLFIDRKNSTIRHAAKEDAMRNGINIEGFVQFMPVKSSSNFIRYLDNSVTFRVKQGKNNQEFNKLVNGQILSKIQIVANVDNEINLLSYGIYDMENIIRFARTLELKDNDREISKRVIMNKQDQTGYVRIFENELKEYNCVIIHPEEAAIIGRKILKIIRKSNSMFDQ